jgi:hypothetical protein
MREKIIERYIRPALYTSGTRALCQAGNVEILEEDAKGTCPISSQ